MRRYLLILVAVLFTCCKKNSQSPDSSPVNSQPIAERKYEVVGLTFSNIPDGYQNIVEQRPNLEYYNGTTINQKVIINPDHIFEFSKFNKPTPDEYKIVNVDNTYSVPENVANNNLILGPQKWLYQEGEAQIPSPLKFVNEANIKPGQKLQIKLFIIYRKISANYLLTLKEKSSGKLVQSKGMWEGRYPLRDSILIVQ
ncbi:hypothetical protein [Mucilaginibacter sp. KACC 22063]|uniref:hypothetical protein n=1 Tax=Mucilaginibacter sp. KACC 22063 TaxID=3025666 RepID=UPI0023656180|nr:hypothetical protein [Mucilaginibacter sp. KACC 22063]WDF54367.1 hypothetical protein PQ461_15600 [Mucilaginibacter sp. KACC 22063]